MNKTSIEWARSPDGSQGYTWNPITGCLNHDNGLCKGGGFPCYAYKLAHGRLRSRYLGKDGHKYTMCDREHDKRLADPFYPRLWEDKLLDFTKQTQRNTKGKGVFVCDMGDLCGAGIPESWTRAILGRIDNINNCRNRFYLLTKQPQNLVTFSPFPNNCWVGVTATNMTAYQAARNILPDIQASVKYISFEPLLGQVIMADSAYLTPLSTHFCDWLIIGACTGSNPDMLKLGLVHRELTPMAYGTKLWTAQPKIEWVREIVEAADKAGIPVFLKDNLKPLIASQCTIVDKWVWAKDLGYGGLLRQEMPK